MFQTISKVLQKYLWLFLFSYLFASCIKEDKEKHVEYYDNGQIKYEVPLSNNKRDGKLIEYYKDGTLEAYSTWKNGSLEGPSAHYYPNGNIKQENYFKNNIFCCESRFYREDGTLQEIHYMNNKGQLLDYKKFNKDGTQNLDIQTREVIFIPKEDTVSLGETYSAKIRVGNKEYNDLEVVLGDPADKYILENGEKLPKVDSVTALLEIEAVREGKHTITGVAVDIDRTNRKEMVIIPFKHTFYVISH